MAKSLSFSYEIPKVVMRITAALIASLLLGMSGPLTVFLPFTPVPFTLQMQLVFLFAAMLGPYYSLIMMGSFLCQGFMGLPVFAGGNPGSLLSPSLGYLIGYVFAARYLGYAFPGHKKGYLKAFGHFTAASLIVYLFGMCYLQIFIGPYKAFLYGVVPFVLTDACKNIVLARLVYPLQRTYAHTAADE